MSEVELELLQLGFPLVEKTERGSCCGDEPTAPYACEWTIQTVELPQPASFGQTPGDPSSSSSSSGTTSGLGMDMSQMGQLTSALSGIGTDGKPASLSDVTSAMSQAMPDGGGGLLQMAVGIVYPTLKPMLEASIRKVTVHVRWREGSRDQVLTAVQYVTNPMEGGLNPNAANAMNALMGMDGGTGMPGMSGTQPGASGVQGSGPASPTPGGGR
jgi:general secretion pathway protein I